MEIFNPQFISQYGKLDTIQVVQLVILLLVGGMLWLNLRQQGAAKQTTQNFNDLTTKLLGNMNTQQSQSNDRENKLATAIDRSARALLLIHKEQKRQGSVMDDTQETLNRYHTEVLKQIDEVKTTLTHDINEVKALVVKDPGKHEELMQSINRVLGYVEGMRLKIRTSETAKFATGEQPKYTPSTDARSEESAGFKVEASEKPK